MLTPTLREMQSRSGTDKALVTDTTSVYKLFRSYLANISPISNTWKCRASHNCSLSENCICHCWHIEPLDTLWRSTSMPWNSQINDGSIGSEIRCSLRSSGWVGAWHLNKIGVGFFGIGCILQCSNVTAIMAGNGHWQGGPSAILILKEGWLLCYCPGAYLIISRATVSEQCPGLIFTFHWAETKANPSIFLNSDSRYEECLLFYSVRVNEQK